MTAFVTLASVFSLKREITQLACLLRLQKHPWCGLWWLQLRPFWRRGAVGILLCTCLQDKIHIPLNNLRRVGKSLGVGTRGRRECENAAVVVVVFLGGLANIGQVLISVCQNVCCRRARTPTCWRSAPAEVPERPPTLARTESVSHAQRGRSSSRSSVAVLTPD